MVAPKTSNKELNPGKGYEKIVADIHRLFAGTTEVTENEKIMGKSGRLRQIDVALRNTIVGYSLLVIVECKDYARRVGVGKVDELIGKIEDVGAAKGILVSDSGFDAGAIARAESDGRVQLASVIDTENGSLRSRIHLPVEVTFYDLISTTYSMEVEFNPTAVAKGSLDQSTRGIQQREAAKVYKDFGKWYLQNAVKYSSGVHEYTAEKFEVEEGTVLVKCVFGHQAQRFINKNLYMEGVGIYDHVKQVVSQGKELNNIHLDFEDIKTRWLPVEEDYIMEDFQVGYAIIHVPPMLA